MPSLLSIFASLVEVMGSVQQHIPQCQTKCWERGQE